ncbi:MAG: hypothetical protein ABI661_09595, partial [Gammaproteobacteria bacterium]
LVMQGRCAPGFERLLKGFSRADLESHAGAVYGLWPDCSLAYVNPAWLHFARSNGGEPAISTRWNLGSCVLDAIPEVLKAFYADLLRAPLSGSAPPARPRTHEYECSSPDLYRRFAMTVYPLEAAEGLLVVNSLRIETPHAAADPASATEGMEGYFDTDGVVRQCAHCRRIRAVDGDNQWDWIPAWVEKSHAATSHTLCNFCLDHYYPADPGGAPAQQP